MKKTIADLVIVPRENWEGKSWDGKTLAEKLSTVLHETAFHFWETHQDSPTPLRDWVGALDYANHRYRDLVEVELRHQFPEEPYRRSLVEARMTRV